MNSIQDGTQENFIDYSKKFTKKEIYYLKMIKDFYNNCDSSYISKMISIVDGNSNISLRILDWFVTRYSHKKKIIINLKNNDEIFDVHISYKAQLKSYKKRYFDPFKRSSKKREKFTVNFGEYENIKQIFDTTIGQLNFFRWAISNKIIDYVEKNYVEIAKEMNISNKEDKRRKKDKQQLKQIAMTTKNKVNIKIDKHTDQSDVKIILTFD